ncbi:MAG TPA: hypothetical protein VMK83_12040 [Gaiellaceae bacterium]|nr:hypothetical protein [Gaiellaceae bacterium]
MPSFFTYQHMPCAECGASVRTSDRERHTCDPERRLEFHLFQVRAEVATFDNGLTGYLDSPHGRFAQWLAEHERNRDT